MSCLPITPEDIQGDKRWLSQHTRIIEDCKLKKPDILFVGDSIIQRMQDTDIWDEQVLPLHAVNAGIGAEQTQHILYRLQNGLLDNCSPKIVVVWAGTNNHSHTSDEIVEGLESIAWCINNSLPNAKIILLGLLPRGEKDNHLRKKNYEINYNLEKIVAGLPNTYYLNPDPGFIRPTGKIAAEDMLDYLHPTRRGYRRMCPIIIGFIRQLLHD